MAMRVEKAGAVSPTFTQRLEAKKRTTKGKGPLSPMTQQEFNIAIADALDELATKIGSGVEQRRLR
jgi:hypothetical protein